MPAMAPQAWVDAQLASARLGAIEFGPVTRVLRSVEGDQAFLLVAVAPLASRLAPPCGATRPRPCHHSTLTSSA